MVCLLLDSQGAREQALGPGRGQIGERRGSNRGLESSP
jgi:hypothetical protein